jgi:hypothetical protein
LFVKKDAATVAVVGITAMGKLGDFDPTGITAAEEHVTIWPDAEQVQPLPPDVAGK